jgi:hypothetical protein
MGSSLATAMGTPSGMLCGFNVRFVIDTRIWSRFYKSVSAAIYIEVHMKLKKWRI